uniref:Uncharacterized protein n=1 Tax=Arundo donax TaxID=35708 RepID=A0A0A9D1N8_ARUDO
MSLALYFSSAAPFSMPPFGDLMPTRGAPISGTDWEMAMRDWRAASSCVNSVVGAAAGEAINQVILSAEMGFLC